MRNLNVEIEDATYEAAKAGAAADGMLLRKWVERAILEKVGPVKVKLREPSYSPVED